jgi:chromate transport protein chrA
MIASAGVLILTNTVWAGEAVALADTNWAMAAIFAVCLVLLRKTKLSPILVMLLAGAVNLLLPA